MHITGLLVDIGGIVTSKEKLKQLWSIPLYSNASYLILANATSALLGFAFWITVARLYSPEDVGLASALIAAIGLLAVFSHLGLGMWLIRFLPHSGGSAKSMINTAFTIGALVSLLAAFIFIGGLSFWSPALLFLRNNLFYVAAFVLFTVASNLWRLTSETFIAERKAGFILSNSLIVGLSRLLMNIILAAFFHSFGIFASWGISLTIALVITLFLFLPRAQPGYRPQFALKIESAKNMLNFSFANYLSVLFWDTSISILSIVVVNRLGAEPNAYFQMAWVVGGLVIMVPSAVSASLFAEGSYDETKLGLNVWRSLKVLFLLLVPAVILIIVIADKLLLLFGGSYSQNATTLLRIFTFSALPLAVINVYLSIKRIEKNLRIIVGLSALDIAGILGLTYVLIPRVGINSIGIAWLTSHSVIACLIVANWLWKWRVSRRRVALE